MKILYVDDDAVARKSILRRIPWEDYGYELMYCAKNGLEAVEYMQEQQPDLILSDIKMPIMDGIQMAIIAKDYYPTVKFIFLSGYKDFEYAQQALKLNAIDYLTKPVMTDTLITALSKAEKMICQEKKLIHITETRHPEIQRHLISQLMYNNFAKTDAAVFQAFDVNLSNGFGTVGFIYFKTIDDISLSSLMNVLQAGCSCFCEQFQGSFFIPIDISQIFFIFTSSNLSKQTDFEEKIRQMQIFVNEWFQSRLHMRGVFYIGSYFQELNDLYLSYKAAEKAKNNQTTDLLSQIRDYILTEYANPDLTLHSIANHFNINHCYLTSMYKGRYGISLYDFLIQVRMERAAELLKTTDMKSYQIAELVGYSNCQYFSLSFKKYYGCTITEYRRQAYPPPVKNQP